MNELLQVGVQVPALFITGGLFLYVLRMVMDIQGRKLDDLTKAINELVPLVREALHERR